MTNAEVYIGDEDLIDQFIDEFNKFACEQDWNLERHCLKERLVEFFKQERTPTLTEDERVILRNIKWKENMPITIGRDEKSGLYISFGDDLQTGYWSNLFFGHLFQSIKERRRI